MIFATDFRISRDLPFGVSADCSRRSVCLLRLYRSSYSEAAVGEVSSVSETEKTRFRCDESVVCVLVPEVALRRQGTRDQTAAENGQWYV